mgnify:CR=1 FL=1
MTEPSTEVSFATSVAATVKFTIAAIIGAAIVVAIILFVFEHDVKIIFILVFLVMSVLMFRQTFTVGPDSLRTKIAMQKKTHSFADTTFRAGCNTGAKSWLQSLSARTNLLTIQTAGKKPVTTPINLSQAEFDALIALLKERGAKVEGA